MGNLENSPNVTIVNDSATGVPCQVVVFFFLFLSIDFDI
jgi:hypothetical protein